MKADLLRKLERIGDRLPANTLDELIDSLGGSENVAEVKYFWYCRRFIWRRQPFITCIWYHMSLFSRWQAEKVGWWVQMMVESSMNLAQSLMSLSKFLTSQRNKDLWMAIRWDYIKFLSALSNLDTDSLKIAWEQTQEFLTIRVQQNSINNYFIEYSNNLWGSKFRNLITSRQTCD